MSAHERLRDGTSIPRLGQGLWRIGERAATRREEVRVLRLGIDLGLTLLDSAQMYGDGGADEVLGHVLTDLGPGRRDDVFVVGKVLPEDATYGGTLAAAERALRRMRTDHIDLYLLHWPSSHPLADTLRAFADLRSAGKIRAYGLSNFDSDDIADARALPAGDAIAVNQCLYNLSRRGPERHLIPWCRENDVLFMSYSPLEQGRLDWTGPLAAVAHDLGATPRQVALAWTLRNGGVVTVVKSAREAHVRENAAAADLDLSPAALATLDRAFPQPDHDVPLEVL